MSNPDYRDSWQTIMFMIMFLGMDNFEALLDGAHHLDKHFREAPIEKNVGFCFSL